MCSNNIENGSHPKKSLFQREFKYFKGKERKPDLNRVIDFSKPNTYSLVRPIATSDLDSPDTTECDALGLRRFPEWKIYTISEKDGFYFVCNPFTEAGQQAWIRRTLDIYPRKPSKTNLDWHHNEGGMWSQNGLPVPELRWCTFGYHHNWNTKVYSRLDHCEFPSCLRRLCKQIAFPFGFGKFEPEASIVHYYRLNSTLSGHVDRSEFAEDAPLFSVSFGQSAVFLLGSEVENDKPLSMFIRSGDVVIMSGGCRYAIHAVPLVVADDAYLGRCCTQDDSEDWKLTSEYLRTTRLNINVRQVFPN